MVGGTGVKVGGIAVADGGTMVAVGGAGVGVDEGTGVGSLAQPTAPRLKRRMAADSRIWRCFMDLLL